MSTSFNPFTELPGSAVSDELLVVRAQAGNWEALEQIIHRHQAWIFNIAVRMVGSREDAEDVTQEVLLKVVTKLSTFEGKSRFRTWLYRIVTNHILDLKQRPGEITFSELGQVIETLPDQELSNGSSSSLPSSVLIEETKVSCTTGMLLCLDRRQRIVYILGEIFGVQSDLGAEILELTPANFRQVLARARRDLSQFMQHHCGLINPENPCRCARKTRAFIDLGRVDPKQRQFTRDVLATVSSLAPVRTTELHTFLEDQHAGIYREHPFTVPPDQALSLRHLLSQPSVRAILSLDM